MNGIALVTGTLLAVYIITGFSKSGWENRPWAYPFLLATFAVYY